MPVTACSIALRPPPKQLLEMAFLLRLILRMELLFITLYPPPLILAVGRLLWPLPQLCPLRASALPVHPHYHPFTRALPPRQPALRWPPAPPLLGCWQLESRRA